MEDARRDKPAGAALEAVGLGEIDDVAGRLASALGLF
jgi:hypothetical protein